MKEILKLTPDQGRQIVYEDSEEFDIIQNDIVDTSRWSLRYEIIVQRVSDNKFFKSIYYVSATESQDERPYEYDQAIFEEVSPVEKTVTVYE